MNMLIIGNGFDLAHERPTTYVDFLGFAKSIKIGRASCRERVFRAV